MVVRDPRVLEPGASRSDVQIDACRPTRRRRRRPRRVCLLNQLPAALFPSSFACMYVWRTGCVCVCVCVLVFVSEHCSLGHWVSLARMSVCPSVCLSGPAPRNLPLMSACCYASFQTAISPTDYPHPPVDVARHVLNLGCSDWPGI